MKEKIDNINLIIDILLKYSQRKQVLNNDDIQYSVLLDSNTKCLFYWRLGSWFFQIGNEYSNDRIPIIFSTNKSVYNPVNNIEVNLVVKSIHYLKYREYIVISDDRNKSQVNYCTDINEIESKIFQLSTLGYRDEILNMYEVINYLKFNLNPLITKLGLYDNTIIDTQELLELVKNFDEKMKYVESKK